MIKKSFLFLVSMLFFTHIFADSIDIDIPDAAFSVQNGFSLPEIAGYDLDGTGEELILPFKKMAFGSEVVKVEILKKHKITLEAPLKKGGALYRLSDMRKVKKINPAKRTLPSLSKFTFDRKPSFKRERIIYSFDFYPIIPAGEKEVIKIDKIRVTSKEKTLLPMSTKSRNSLLILTTDYFLAESKEIENYIEVKKEYGFDVDVATEKDYEGGQLRGIERAKKIREYLKKVYKKYDFLLIIAGTDPEGNEVPMIVTRPCITDEPYYDDVPTDIFYAEITEELDSSGNGIYGEYDDMIEYDFELITGRIPIYGKDVSEADKILKRTVEFIREKPSAAEYRREILFPTTISYYKSQDNQYRIPKMDGAYVAEYLMKKSIREPFSTKILVEKEGIDPSEFDEEALTYESMLENMNISHGIVFWQAHGLEDSSARTIWYDDKNNNGIPETYSYELYSDIFVDNNLINSIGTMSPFVFQGSCLNGSIQAPDSLSYNTLKNLSVGVVGASQVSYGLIFSDYNLSSQDIFAYGAVFTDALVNDRIPAEVLFEKKEEWSDRDVLLTVKHETNYLGDPSLNLNLKTCSTDSDCDDSLFCNGSEICAEGFCEKVENSKPCTENDNICESIECDESQKSCKISPLPDGFVCGTPENACIGGKQCISGKCSDVDVKDCSEFDSECSQGSCDPGSGECVRLSANEGESCSSGRICVKNEVCIQGSCEGEEADMPAAKECSKTECSESDGFFETADPSQNGNDCTTDDGKEGYCDYGSCTQKQQEEKEEKQKSSSSGCSALIL